MCSMERGKHFVLEKPTKLETKCTGEKYETIQTVKIHNGNSVCCAALDRSHFCHSYGIVFSNSKNLCILRWSAPPPKMLSGVTAPLPSLCMLLYYIYCIQMTLHSCVVKSKTLCDVVIRTLVSTFQYVIFAALKICHYTKLHNICSIRQAFVLC